MSRTVALTSHGLVLASVLKLVFRDSECLLGMTMASGLIENTCLSDVDSVMYMDGSKDFMQSLRSR